MSNRNMDMRTEERVTIRVAAKALRVSTKTIRRYLEKGILTRIKEGPRVYVLSEEIHRILSTHRQDFSTEKQSTITLTVSKYEELLKQLGELQKQAEFLFEYRAMIQTKDEQLKEKHQQVTELQGQLREAERKAAFWEGEAKRLKSLSWWKQLFGDW